ncbi:hypothetical protein J3Q64DRAFT_1073333 [Phycomyces blakesleeanus]|uniref:HECT-type E3 ubiquitin transferase n=1 Tax=Phycomyces blakesleeanus TaxID=4837 RepID=A0ABR3BG00_PHYBL
MNFNFEGNYRAKRTINLGGVKPNDDKRSLMAKTQSERRAREFERKKLRSAGLIQAFYRGRKEAARNSRYQKASFQNILTSLSALLQEQDPKDAEIVDKIEKAIRNLLVFYRNHKQEDRLMAADFCRLLLRPTQPSRRISVFQLQFMHRDIERVDQCVWQTILLMKKVLFPLLESAERDSDVTLLPVLQLIALHLTPHTYTELEHIESPFTPSVIHTRMLTYDLLSGHLLRALRSFYKYTSTRQPDIWNQASEILICVAEARPPFELGSSIIGKWKPQTRPLFGLFSGSSSTITPKKTSEPELSRQLILEMFTVDILTLPFIFDLITTDAAVKLLRQLSLNDVLEMIIGFYEKSWPRMVNPEQIASLLINITKMGNLQSGAYLDQGLKYYVRVVQYLFAEISPIYFIRKNKSSTELKATDSDSDDSDEEQEDTVMSEVLEPSARLDPMIQARLESLYTTEKINTLVQRCINLSVTENNGSKINQFIGPMATLFTSLMISWPSKKDDLLGTFLYNRWGPEVNKPGSIHLTQLLWQAWSNTECVTMFDGHQSVNDISKKIPALSDPKYADSWSILYLLCEIYTRILFTIGDDEFFDKSLLNNQLRIDQVIQLSGQLKAIAFLLFWKSGSIDMEQYIDLTSIQLGQLGITVVNLLQQIHIRDSRRPFCPKDHWFLNGLDTESFANDTLAEEYSLEDEPRQPGLRQSIPKGKLSIVSPRIGLLNNMPFVIPFEDRVKIFKAFVDNDRKRNSIDDFMGRAPSVTIHRNNVLEDGFTQLYPLGANLKKRIAISFVDEFGLLEAGIDGGGVFKEFLTCLGHEAFDTNYGLFLATPDQLLYPNPSALISNESLAEKLVFYEFLGLIIGKALYEGILLDVAFAEFFLKRCLGKVNYLDDLPSLDPELYKGLIEVKNFQGNVEDLCLDFSLAETADGKSKLSFVDFQLLLISNGCACLTRENCRFS